MAMRYDLPRIIPDKKPSMLNHSMGLGGWVGMVVGNTLALLTGAALAGPLCLGLVVAGALIGGVMGKRQEERDQAEGRVVKNPGFLNKGIFSGIAAGVFLGMVPVVGPVLWLGAVVAGSLSRRNELQHDYQRAVGVQQAQLEAGAAQNRARTLEQGYSRSVSPEESAMLDARQKHGRGMHADAVEQSRAIAAEAGRA